MARRNPSPAHWCGAALRTADSETTKKKPKVYADQVFQSAEKGEEEGETTERQLKKKTLRTEAKHQVEKKHAVDETPCLS